VAARIAAVDWPRSAAASRVLHPFPSILDGIVVAMVALVAGGGGPRALVLGLSMTFLQFSIGAFNDFVDAPADADRKPGKPIPEGLVRRRDAALVALGCAGTGLLLSLVGGQSLVTVAVVGLIIGAAYDVFAKGTSLSWLPFALGIPLLPLFGWYGATGMVPGLFVVLLPAAANAGAALAIANSLVDIERDAGAGKGSVAAALGPRLASRIVLGLHVVVAGLATLTAWYSGAPGGWVLAVILCSGVPIGGACLGILGAIRDGTSLREFAWEVQAVGTGLLAVAFLTAVSAAVDALQAI
jgi:4-hydroxybenzoate polyprenyltransferase